MKMTGNTILVTGGGSGIGRALAEALLARDNQIIIAGRRQQVLDEVVAANPGMSARVLDIGNAESVRTFAARIQQDFPALNAIIHSAGIMKLEQPGEDDGSVAEETIAINLLGPVRLTSALLPHLKKQRTAAIMTVSSGLAFVPKAGTATYCATKAAIHSYTQSLRYLLADTAIDVVELIPPYVQTGLMGTAQASDPHAMPLAAFIEESLQIMASPAGQAEICVERVRPLRFAAENGQEKYTAFFTQFNDMQKKAAEQK